MRRINDGFPREPAPWRTKTGNHEHLFVTSAKAREAKARRYAAVLADETAAKAKRVAAAQRWIDGMKAAKARATTKPNGMR